MKKIIATGALGLGIGISGGVVTDSDDVEERTVAAGQHHEHVHHPNLVLLFADDYHSNGRFRPIDRIPQRAVNAILGSRMEGDPAVSEPTDYHGYVVRVKSTQHAPGEYTFAFVNERTFQQDRWYRLTDDVVFFDTESNLLSVAIATDTGGRERPTSEETTGETTTTEETTTQAVIVNTTEADNST